MPPDYAAKVGKGEIADPNILKTIVLVDAATRGIVPTTALEVKAQTVEKGGYVVYNDTVSGALAELCAGTCDTHADCSPGHFCSSTRHAMGFPMCLPCAECKTGRDSIDFQCPTGPPNGCNGVLCRQSLGHFVAINNGNASAVTASSEGFNVTCDLLSDEYGSGKRTVSFQWTNPRHDPTTGALAGSKDCNLEDQLLSSDGSHLKDQTFPCPWVESGSPAAVATFFIGILGASLSVGFAACIAMFRHSPSVRFGQPLYLFIFTAGCVVVNFSMVPAVGVPTVGRCAAQAWLFHLGFTITFAPIFLKVYRIWKIVEASQKFRRSVITREQILVGLAALLTVDVVVLSIWQATDPVAPVAFEETVHWGTLVGTQCGSRHDTFAIVLLLYKVFILVVGCFVSFRARHIDRVLAEGRHLFFAIYNTAFIGLIEIILIFATDLPRSTLTMLAAGGIFVSTMISCATILYPKLRKRNMSYDDLMKTSNLTTAGSTSGGRDTMGRGEYGGSSNDALDMELASMSGRASVAQIQSMCSSLSDIERGELQSFLERGKETREPSRFEAVNPACGHPALSPKVAAASSARSASYKSDDNDEKNDSKKDDDDDDDDKKEEEEEVAAAEQGGDNKEDGEGGGTEVTVESGGGDDA